MLISLELCTSKLILLDKKIQIYHVVLMIDDTIKLVNVILIISTKSHYQLQSGEKSTLSFNG